MLMWNPLLGASSYNIKRSTTSGGPYSAISSAGAVTGTNYIDETAINGTTYYYVVSAATSISAAAETANSPVEVSVTPATPMFVSIQTSGDHFIINWPTGTLQSASNGNILRPMGRSWCRHITSKPSANGMAAILPGQIAVIEIRMPVVDGSTPKPGISAKNILDFIQPETRNLRITQRKKTAGLMHPGTRFISVLELLFLCILVIRTPAVL